MSRFVSFQSLYFNHYTVEGALFSLVFLCLFWKYLQCLDWNGHWASNSMYLFSDFQSSFTFFILIFSWYQGEWRPQTKGSFLLFPCFSDFPSLAVLHVLTLYDLLNAVRADFLGKISDCVSIWMPLMNHNSFKHQVLCDPTPVLLHSFYTLPILHTLCSRCPTVWSLTSFTL